MTRRTRSPRGQWWIAVAAGYRYFALWSCGARETWATDRVSRGPVFGITVGRVDG